MLSETSGEVSSPASVPLCMNPAAALADSARMALATAHIPATSANVANSVSGLSVPRNILSSMVASFWMFTA